VNTATGQAQTGCAIIPALAPSVFAAREWTNYKCQALVVRALQAKVWATTSWFHKSQSTQDISLVLPDFGLMPRLTSATVWSPTFLTSGPLPPTTPINLTCSVSKLISFALPRFQMHHKSHTGVDTMMYICCMSAHAAGSSRRLVVLRGWNQGIDCIGGRQDNIRLLPDWCGLTAMHILAALLQSQPPRKGLERGLACLAGMDLRKGSIVMGGEETDSGLRRSEAQSQASLPDSSAAPWGMCIPSAAEQRTMVE